MISFDFTDDLRRFVIMRKSMLVLAAAALCTANTVTAVVAQTLDVVGLDGKTVAVSLDTLQRRTIVTEDRGVRVEFQGFALRDVLIEAGIPFGDALKGPALTRVIIASARDGYRVAYAIAELDATFTDQVVLVADRRDGRPLLPDTGPLQVVVPNDKRAARWIRQVNKIEVRQLQ